MNNNRRYIPIEFIVYDVPETAALMQSYRESHQWEIVDDAAFAHSLTTNPRIYEPFWARMNYFYDSTPTPDNLKWENIDKEIRNYIIVSLRNHATNASSQVLMFRGKLIHIQQYEERQRIYIELKKRLKHAYWALKPFRQLDRRIDNSC